MSLEEEIQYIENYIELQELRINKSLDISFQKDVEDIKTQIAPLLLIIPIENAFKHGVDSLLQQAFVHISIRQKGEKLSLEVYNNFDTKEASKETGIGLQNLQKRLNLLYKNRYELDANKTKDEFNFSLKIRT